jgi:hypothetical protein
VGGEIFRTCPERPLGPPSLLSYGYRLYFPVVKRPGLCVDYPLPSSAKIKERVELYLYYPLDLSGFAGLVVSMLASGIQDRGFEPGRSRLIFLAKKYTACLPSEMEVKPSVPCLRFAAC